MKQTLICLLALMLIASPACAEKDLNDYKVGETHYLQNGDGCIVTGTMPGGIMCSERLYQEREAGLLKIREIEVLERLVDILDKK